MEVKLLHATPLWTIANAIRYSHSNHYLSDSLPIRMNQLGENLYDTKYHCAKCEKELFYDTEIDALVCFSCEYDILANEHIGKKDFNLIKKVGFKYKHESVLEFGQFVFSIEGISRAVLQELARHRLASLTVKSTRYTLKELKKEKPFTEDLVTLMRDEEFDDEKALEKIFYQEPEVQRASKYIVLTGHPATDTTSVVELEMLRRLIKNGKANDIAKYALPEAYKTSLQWGINLRSLINFLELRLSKDALWEIRNLALKILEEIQEKSPLYFELLMENNIILSNYEKYRKQAEK